MSERISIKDLDFQIRVRSSKMSVTDLQKITTLVVETLVKSGELNLVEQNTTVNRTNEKSLITITSTFQSEN